MKKALLLCVGFCLLIACDVFFIKDRNPNGIAWGGGAFASGDHQLTDFGFMRLQGRNNLYETGMSFQFPAIGVYGGNDHFSIGLLIGFTIYYREKTYNEPNYYSNSSEPSTESLNYAD